MARVLLGSTLCCIFLLQLAAALPPGAVNAKAVVLEAPRPEYPKDLRQRGVTGAGVFVLHVNRRTGVVTSVTVQQSTGVARLDACAIDAFRRWRFKPPAVSSVVRIPITFVQTGAKY
jgi:TonB family protein